METVKATCHPEKEAVTDGLCYECLLARNAERRERNRKVKVWRDKKVPTCHPEAKYRGRGLCVSCYCKEDHLKNKKRRNAKSLTYFYNNQKRLIANYVANARLKKYGAGVNSVEWLFKFHGHACAICGEMYKFDPKKVGRKIALVVDHDHATNKIRGILCGKCNVGLGFFSDRPELLRAAATYLERAFEVPPEILRADAAACRTNRERSPAPLPDGGVPLGSGSATRVTFCEWLSPECGGGAPDGIPTEPQSMTEKIEAV